MRHQAPGPNTPPSRTALAFGALGLAAVASLCNHDMLPSRFMEQLLPWHHYGAAALLVFAASCALIALPAAAPATAPAPQ